MANKPKQKYGLFAKLSLALIGACEVAKNPHTFITRENQHIREINRNFYGNLNHFGPMVFAEKQEKWIIHFKDMFHWTLMIKSEVKNSHKNKDGKLKNILSIWYFKQKILSYGRWLKQKYRLYAHWGM